MLQHKDYSYKPECCLNGESGELLLQKEAKWNISEEETTSLYTSCRC